MGEHGYLLHMTATTALWLPANAHLDAQARLVARFTCLEHAQQELLGKPAEEAEADGE